MPDDRNRGLRSIAGKQMHLEAVGMDKIRSELLNSAPQAHEVGGGIDSAGNQVAQEIRASSTSRRIDVRVNEAPDRPRERNGAGRDSECFGALQERAFGACNQRERPAGLGLSQGSEEMQ